MYQQESYSACIATATLNIHSFATAANHCPKTSLLPKA